MWKKNVKFHISIYRIVQNQCERWNTYKMCKVQTGREVCAIYNLGWFIMVWIWSFETGFAWNTASCRLRNNSCLSHTYDTSVIMSHRVKLWGSNNLVTWPQWDRKSTQLGSKLWPMCGFNTVGFDGFNPSPRGSKKWYNWKPETRILSTFQTTNGDVPKHVFTSVMFGSHMSHMYLFVHKHSIVISWMWKKWKKRSMSTKSARKGSPGLAPSRIQGKVTIVSSNVSKKNHHSIHIKMPALIFSHQAAFSNFSCRFFTSRIMLTAWAMMLVKQFQVEVHSIYPSNIGIIMGIVRKKMDFHLTSRFHLFPTKMAKYIKIHWSSHLLHCCSLFFVKSQNLHRWRADPWTKVAAQIVHTLTWRVFGWMGCSYW